MNPLDYLFQQQQSYNGNPGSALQGLMMNQGNPVQNDPFAGQVQTPQANQYGWQQLQALNEIDAQEPTVLDYGQGAMPSPQANYTQTPMGNQNMGGPQVPVSSGNTKTIIQRQLGALPQSQPDTVSNILSGRFQPDQMSGMGTGLGDYAQGIASSALGKPMLGQQIAQARDKDIMTQLIAMKRLEQMAGSGGNTVFAQKLALLNNDPATKDLPDATKLSLAQASAGQGQAYGLNGLAPIKGAPEATETMSKAKQSGKEQGTLDYAARIEAEKKIGQGEITDVQKRQMGGNNVSNIIGKMQGNYQKLDDMGAITSTNRSAADNLKISTFQTSQMGQAYGKRTGSQDQAVRQVIEASIPRLMTSIKNATGMSAQEVNSIPEMQLMKQSVSDPTYPIEAVREILNNLNENYGAGGTNNIMPGNNPMGGGNQQPSGPDLSDPGFQAFLKSKGHM